MAGRYHGRQIPWDEYHGVPAGWQMLDILALHTRHAGDFPIGPTPQPSANCRRYAPVGQAWCEYRATLYGVADGLLADDPACVEIAVRYIERHFIGSYSGFLRARMARRLRHATRHKTQDDRLNEHFARMVAQGDRCHEFGEYLRLWRQILTPKRLRRLNAILAWHGASEAQTQWVHGALRTSHCAASAVARTL